MHEPASAWIVELVDAMGMLLCAIDRDGRIAMANRQCAELTGIARDELHGVAWCELFADPTRRGDVAALWQQLSPSQPSQPFESLCREGRRLRWQFFTWPQVDGGVCAVGHDITEERDQRARVRSLDRLSALGNLCAGLAHEVRNPLNSASLQLALIERKLAKLPDSAAVHEHVAEAAREIGRIAALLDDFIAFARPRPLEARRVALGVLVERALERARGRAEAAAITLEAAPCPQVSVEVDAPRVEGALYSLIANAVDAVGSAEAPRVAVRCVAASNSVVIEVADNGPGLPSPDAPIFDPFFTTKPDGTGLGLAIVERVAIDHGGTVEVERAAGTTVFRLRLPIVSQ